MKYFAIFICLMFTTICHANIQKDLTYSVMTYEEVLNWSKKKIYEEAKNDFSKEEVKSSLNDFPVTLVETCGDLTLLFIKNTPQCGNVNCKYFIFKLIPNTLVKKYHYLGEKMCAAERLVCYPKQSQYNYYLITNEHETNSTALFQIYQIMNDKLMLKSSINIDYTRASEREFAESLWDKSLKENILLKSGKK